VSCGSCTAFPLEAARELVLDVEREGVLAVIVQQGTGVLVVEEV